MSDTQHIRNKLQYWNDYHHWKILALVLYFNYISFLTQTLTQHTCPNIKLQTLIISFLSVCDMYVEYYSV